MLDRPPISQPVVACDPTTQDRWLNVNKGYTFRIQELTANESHAILPMLFSHITKPEHCVRLHYDVGDIILFDNHRLQHYAVSDYYPARRRLLRMSFDAQLLQQRLVDNGCEEKKEGLCPIESMKPVPLSKLGERVADLATELTAGIHLLHQGQQSDLCAGFLSARLHDDLYLSPSHGVHWNEVTPSTFGVYRGNTRLAGEGRLPNFPTTAVPAAIYREFPEIQAIVHAHPRSVMALAALDDNDVGKVLPISEPSFMFYERVAHIPCNFFFDDKYIGQMLEALRGGAFCLMMRNHSYTMVGRSIQEAYLRCYMLEQSVAIQLKTLAANGGRLPRLPDREECLYHRRSYEGYDGCPPYDGALEWPGLIRSLDKDHPGWAGDQGKRLGHLFDAANGS